MRLPEVKFFLLEICKDERLHPDLAKQIKVIAREINRRKPLKVSRKISSPMTKELRQQIIRFSIDNPLLSQLEISRKFNVNPGRVSETLRGFRD